METPGMGGMLSYTFSILIPLLKYHSFKGTEIKIWFLELEQT